MAQFSVKIISLTGSVLGENQHYVYLLQDALRFRGHFDASPTGRLDRRTINAFQAACRDLNQSVLCGHGPLTETSVRIAASFLRGQ